MLFAVWQKKERKKKEKKKKKEYVVQGPSQCHLCSRLSVLRKVIQVWGLFSGCTDSTSTNSWFLAHRTAGNTPVDPATDLHRRLLKA